MTVNLPARLPWPLLLAFVGALGLGLALIAGDAFAVALASVEMSEHARERSRKGSGGAFRAQSRASASLGRTGQA